MTAFQLRDTLDFPRTCGIGRKDRMFSRSSVVLRTCCAGPRVLLTEWEDMMRCACRGCVCVVLDLRYPRKSARSELC